MSNLPSAIHEIVDPSKQQEILLDLINYAKKKGADEVEISAAFSLELMVATRAQKVENLEFNRDKGFGVTIYCNKQKAVTSCNDSNISALKQTIDTAIQIAKYSEKDEYAGLPDEDKLAKVYPDLQLYLPWIISLEDAINIALEAEQAGFAESNKITNSEGATVNTTQSISFLINSLGFFGYYPASYHSLSCTMIAQDDKGMERDYEYTCHRDFQKLDAANNIGKIAAQKALRRLSSRQIKTGEYKILFAPNVAKTLLSHFIQSISGGNLFRKTSFLLNSLHTSIFPKFFNMTEKPHILHGIASAPFDGEGVKTYDKSIVTNGIVQSYILSSYSARKLGMQTTGNSGGTGNVFLTSTGKSFENLCQQIDKGLLVTEVMGPGVNLVTGDYSRGASGFWIEKGIIQYPVSEITIASNLKDMFKNIVEIGEDIDYRSGICTGSILINKIMVGGI